MLTGTPEGVEDDVALVCCAELDNAETHRRQTNPSSRNYSSAPGTSHTEMVDVIHSARAVYYDIVVDDQEAFFPVWPNE